MPRKGVLLQHRFGLCCQGRKAFAHVGDARRPSDPRVSRNRDHVVRPRISRARASGSKLPLIRIRWLEQRCVELWREIPQGALPGTIADVWTEEQVALMPLPQAFDGSIEKIKRVSPTCLIGFDRNRYSVPASFANHPVSLRSYPERLVVVAEGQILCEHARLIQRSHDVPARTIYDWRQALLRKCPEGRSIPFPGQIYSVRWVSGVPRAVKRFRMAALI